MIIIDTIQTSEPPGTIFRLTPANIRSYLKGEHYSLHQTGIPDLLRIAEAIGQPVPEVVIFALQPADISIGTELSPIIEEKIPELIQCVLKEIEAS